MFCYRNKFILLKVQHVHNYYITSYTNVNTQYLKYFHNILDIRRKKWYNKKKDDSRKEKIMQQNDKIHGFTVRSKTEIKEIKAALFTMEHEKSGAKLYFLDREDENKTFSITFKTIPNDSTGVFHIIEHAVLCGSKKYPVKEPFVELLKGSLNTFLNAMTFSDKTMYPISTRNDKDFLNLTAVYLDAVFHPAILENPNIFRQEGWHYELDESGELTRSGVVLNEMKGAFSSPDDLASFHLCEMLYPDTCYRYESGGAPDDIPTLTYEEFCAAHKKYYHPSNAEIFLDGSVKLDEALPLIDGVLSDYDREDLYFDIPDQKPISPVTRTVEYEIADGESEVDKTRLCVGFMSSRFDEQEALVATEVLTDAIASTNESPLKKIIIDSGLCEDMSISSFDSVKQNSITVEFFNVKDGKEEQLYSLFEKSVEEIVAHGIDKKLLDASLSRLEFKTREKDHGTMPIGIIYAISVLESTLYGGKPAQNLSYEKTFIALRNAIKTNYFENLLESIFINNTHRATLVMHPSSTLGERRADKEHRALRAVKESLTEEQLRDIEKTDEALKAWQRSEDTPQALATIPGLKISDISADVEKIPATKSDVCGTTVLDVNVVTNGIVYTELYFDASDLDEKEIFDLRMLVSLIENVRTEKRKAIELQNFIKGELGSLSVSMSSLTGKSGAKIYVTVSASALESKKDKIIEILPEILYTSVYNNKEICHNILRQLKLASEEAFTSSGHLAAFRRATSYLSAEGAIQEYYAGYEAYCSMKALEESFDVSFEPLARRITALADRIFTKERLTVAICGASNDEFAKELISGIKSGEKYAPVLKIKPLGARREGFVIPARTSYTALAANLCTIGERRTGTDVVVRSILSYGYLWNTVRVQGGAYGVGLISRNNGALGFYSYRDPSPARTIDCFKGAAENLRSVAMSGEDVTKFIIGAIGEISPLTTPKIKINLVISRFLREFSYEDECTMRREILDTGSKQLLKAADTLDKLCALDCFTVFGAKENVESFKNLDAILQI